MISTPWPVGVLRNVPTIVCRASRRARKLAAIVIARGFRPSGLTVGRPVMGRHRILRRIEHPAWLLGEVQARRAEDVDELIGAGADRFGGVDRSEERRVGKEGR